jgi:hypothetical protein
MHTATVSANGWVVIPRAMANHAIAYADAFAAALAQESAATLVTGDPEFVLLKDILEIKWLPQRASSRHG